MRRAAVRPCGCETLVDQRGEHVLLGEGLGADHVSRRRRGKAGRQRGEHQRDQPRGAESGAGTAAPGERALHQRQQLVDGERQRRGGDAAEHDEHPVLRLQAGEDVIAEAGLADRRRQGRGADHPDRGGADAGHDHRQRQRQFDIAQRLPAGSRRGRARRRAAADRARRARSRCCASPAASHRAPAPAPRAGSRAPRSRRRTSRSVSAESASSSG